MPVIFHIQNGRYDGIALDGLNVALAIHTPGPMADGIWSVAAYIDERADDEQTGALSAIFNGAAGGPMAAFAADWQETRSEEGPNQLRIQGKKRAQNPVILHMAVAPLPTAHPSGGGRTTAIPLPRQAAFAVGAPGNTFNDHGMRWDNSGKNGHLRADPLVKSGVMHFREAVLGKAGDICNR